MTVAFGVMWAVTGSLAFGGIAAVVEPVCNVALLPLHDRLWRAIQRRLRRRSARRDPRAAHRDPRAAHRAQLAAQATARKAESTLPSTTSSQRRGKDDAPTTVPSPSRWAWSS